MGQFRGTSWKIGKKHNRTIHMESKKSHSNLLRRQRQVGLGPEQHCQLPNLLVREHEQTPVLAPDEWHKLNPNRDGVVLFDGHRV